MRDTETFVVRSLLVPSMGITFGLHKTAVPNDVRFAVHFDEARAVTLHIDPVDLREQLLRIIRVLPRR